MLIYVLSLALDSHSVMRLLYFLMLRMLSLACLLANCFHNFLTLLELNLLIDLYPLSTVELMVYKMYLSYLYISLSLLPENGFFIFSVVVGLNSACGESVQTPTPLSFPLVFLAFWSSLLSGPCFIAFPAIFPPTLQLFAKL